MLRATRRTIVMRQLSTLAAAAIALGILTSCMTAHTRSNSSLEASPTSGTAPFAVTFTGTGSGELEGVMVLDFGDGQKDHTISTIRGFRRTHTYTTAGSYTAELRSGADGGQRPSVLTTVGTVTITVH